MRRKASFLAFFAAFVSLCGPARAIVGDCKGTASIVTVSHYYGWILETASKLGAPLN